jgi:serine/threonine protein kinase/Tol biopolymer transport system component
MTPERWQRVDEIFQAAIELKPEERPAFVERTCAGDEELQREVESLITADEQGLSFVDEPAFQVAASLLTTGEPQLAEGQSISHYEIIGPIGRGGMGEVYLAKDKLLNRRIALKLLPSDYTRNKDRLRRFQQEAQAASSLNHPNILTIHELGQVNEQQFIATEFVEGETLRQRLKRAPLTQSETLDIAIQIASALSAAHRAGIVHRDIKPENIMLRPDGYVKVLDFGLAKLTQQEEQPPGPIETDKTETSSGLVMGTVKYMSPEQAQGQQVDQRSDIFSFGVVLYEMLAGRAPFDGETSSELISSILKKEPPPLTDGPDGIGRLIGNALHKRKEDRYQTIEDLLGDLKQLRGDKAVTEPGAQAAHQTINGSSLITSAAAAASTVSTFEYVVSGIKRHKTGAALVLASLAIVALGATFGLNRFRSNTRPWSKEMRIERIPETEKAGGVAVSPDGQYIAYTARRGLWIKRLGTSSSLQIVTASNVFYPTYSPDGEDIFYVSNDSLYRIPARGGEAAKVLADVNGHGPISFAPDGNRFAFTRYADEEKVLLLVANADGTGERVLASRKRPEVLYSPAWAPEGSLIACVGGAAPTLRVFGIRVATGEEEQITSYKWAAIERLAWLGDGSGLVASAMETSAAPKQIWQIRYPAGEPRKITNDFESYADVSLSADGKSLVTIQSARLSSLWVAPKADPTSTRSIPFGERKLSGSVSWTPDGRILCLVNTSAGRDIWVVNADGTNPKQLTENAGKNLQPNPSPDGHYIVFSSNRGAPGASHIWRMDLDGNNPIQVTQGDGDGEVQPTVSPDGLWVVYSKGGPDTGIEEKTVWKAPIDGGEPIQLANTPSSGAAISPDGTLIACWYKQDKTSRWQIALIPLTGGLPTRILDIDRASIVPLRWTPDGQAISYVDTREGVSNIWSQPISGSPPNQLTQFTSEKILGFDWSSDGQLVCSRMHDSQDVVLISDFR